jgi:hypothetical protein
MSICVLSASIVAPKAWGVSSTPLKIPDNTTIAYNNGHVYQSTYIYIDKNVCLYA